MRKLKSVLIDLFVIVLVITTFVADAAALKVVHQDKVKKEIENRTAEEYVRDGKIKFPYTGTAGSMTTEKGNYTVALNNGDPNGGSDDQKIVDNDYSALLGTEKIYDENNVAIEGESLKVVLDHDTGIPPALPAVIESTKLYIKNKEGKVTGYEKVAQFTTGDRQTRDLLTDTGHSVLEKSFIEEFGDPSTMIAFITCDGDGRLISFWKPE